MSDRTECLSTKEKSQVDESGSPNYKSINEELGLSIDRLESVIHKLESENIELKYQAGLPKVPQSEETRALTKRILELEKERDTFEARWELIKADNEELEKEKAELKLELNGYYKMAASGVWVETEDYAAQHNQQDQLRAECARLRGALAECQETAWRDTEDSEGLVLEICALTKEALAVTNG